MMVRVVDMYGCVMRWVLIVVIMVGEGGGCVRVVVVMDVMVNGGGGEIVGCGCWKWMSVIGVVLVVVEVIVGMVRSTMNVA
jgi:hypothetical protein